MEEFSRVQDVHKMNDNVRRFLIAIVMSNGKEYKLIRECARPIPPTGDWVVSDFRGIIANGTHLNIETVDGVHVSIRSSEIAAIELLHTKEGLNIEEMKERYNLAK